MWHSDRYGSLARETVDAERGEGLKVERNVLTFGAALLSPQSTLGQRCAMNDIMLVISLFIEC